MFDSFHIQQVSFGKRLMYATIMNPPFLIIIRIHFSFSGFLNHFIQSSKEWKVHYDHEVTSLCSSCCIILCVSVLDHHRICPCN